MKPKLVNQNNFGGRKGFYLKSADQNQGGPSPSVMWIKAEPQKMFQIEFQIMFWVISALPRSVRDLNYGQPKSNGIPDSLFYIGSNVSLMHSNTVCKLIIIEPI